MAVKLLNNWAPRLKAWYWVPLRMIWVALGQYGVKTIHQAELQRHVSPMPRYSKVLAEVATATGATVIVFSNNLNGKAIAPRLSARLKAGLVSGAVALPDTSSRFRGKKECILR